MQCAAVLWVLWKLRNGLCFQGKIWRQVEPVLGAGGGGKDTGQMEAFNQGEQEIRDGLLHWVAGTTWGKGTDDRVDEFRVGDIFICAVPAGL